MDQLPLYQSLPPDASIVYLAAHTSPSSLPFPHLTHAFSEIQDTSLHTHNPPPNHFTASNQSPHHSTNLHAHHPHPSSHNLAFTPAFPSSSNASAYSRSSTVRYIFTVWGRFIFNLCPNVSTLYSQRRKKKERKGDGSQERSPPRPNESILAGRTESTHVGVKSSFSIENGSTINTKFLTRSYPANLFFRPTLSSPAATAFFTFGSVQACLIADISLARMERLRTLDAKGANISG